MASRFLKYPYNILTGLRDGMLSIFNIAIGLFRIVFIPWYSSFEPIQSLVTGNTEEPKDRQTLSWRDLKLAELSSVSLTGAILASVVAQTFQWPQTQTASSKLPLGLWCSSLSLCFATICLATQQTVALNRISAYEDAPKRIRFLIGEKLRPLKDISRERPEKWIPSKTQLYVWQAPIMCLNFGIAAFVIGFAVLMFGSVNRSQDSGSGVQAVMTLEGKDLIIPGLIGGFAVTQYVLAAGLLYYRISIYKG